MRLGLCGRAVVVLCGAQCQTRIPKPPLGSAGGAKAIRPVRTLGRTSSPGGEGPSLGLGLSVGRIEGWISASMPPDFESWGSQETRRTLNEAVAAAQRLQLQTTQRRLLGCGVDLKGPQAADRWAGLRGSIHLLKHL